MFANFKALAGVGHERRDRARMKGFQHAPAGRQPPPSFPSFQGRLPDQRKANRAYLLSSFRPQMIQKSQLSSHHH